MKTKTVPNLKTTLGSDPELLLFDLHQGKIVSAITVLGRDKHDPIDLGDGIKMYSDNVLVEAAFPPADSKQGILDSFRKVFSRMKNQLGERYTLLPMASHVYADDELKEPVAWESGCSPNYDVYARKSNLPADFTNGLRTGSFHIHIGNADWKKKDCSQKLLTLESKEQAIKLLDIFVGVSSVIFDRDPTAHARRRLYGKAGEFRPTPYGVEYRVLGNFPLRSPAATMLVFDLVDLALDHVRSDTEKDALAMFKEEEVRSAINDHDVGLAEMICSALPDHLQEAIHKDYDADFSKAWSLV